MLWTTASGLRSGMLLWRWPENFAWIPARPVLSLWFIADVFQMSAVGMTDISLATYTSYDSSYLTESKNCPSYRKRLFGLSKGSRERWKLWSEATDNLGNDDVTQSHTQTNHTRWPQDVSRSSCCILHVVMEWLVNKLLERIWKEVNVVRLGYHYGICGHRLGKTSSQSGPQFRPLYILHIGLEC